MTWAPYKVFSWVEASPPGYHAKQVRCIAAADSAAKVLNAGASRWNFSETGNTESVEAALAHPGVVLFRGLDDRGAWEFHPRYPKLDVKEVKPKTKDYVRAARVFNSYEFHGESPYVVYVSDSGRGSFGSEAQVILRGVNLSGMERDKVHWRHTVNRKDGTIPKTFKSMSSGAAAKREAMAEALAWASDHFGVAAWKTDPFGGHGPADFVKARTAELVKQGKEVLGV